MQWGFAAEQRAEQTNPDREIVDWFKVYLDDGLLAAMRERDPENTPSSIAEVETWFEDFLRQLYKHIEFRLGSELPVNKTWAGSLIEFIFSVPTTWPPPTVERFRSILSRAGYNQFPYHSISVGLTEAEAAAVSTSVEAPGMFREHEIILVCDVGGGTTDLGVLSVENVGSAAISLKQLDVVQGRSIGSVKIDEAFEKLVLEKLQRADAVKPLGVEIEAAAWHMMKSREYQNAKCDHGSPDDTIVFVVPVTDLSTDYVNEAHGISNGGMQFTQSELRTLFDVQVNRLFELIDKQLTRFQTKSPNAIISHLVLSGGLGNSAYVQSRLEKRYAFGLSTFPSARNIQVHVAPEPQLSVCKGIVMDRVRKLSSGTGVLGWRCSRGSFGTICKMPYDPRNPSHAGRQVIRDQYNGKMYLINAIEWFIYKGQPINSDTPITRPFTRKLAPGEVNRTFPTSVVTSDVDIERLPLQLNNGKPPSGSHGHADDADAQVLCKIVSDLSAIQEGRFKLVSSRPKPSAALTLPEKPPLVEHRQALSPLQLRRQGRHRPCRHKLRALVRGPQALARQPDPGAVAGLVGSPARQPHGRRDAHHARHLEIEAGRRAAGQPARGRRAAHAEHDGRAGAARLLQSERECVLVRGPVMIMIYHVFHRWRL
jgi:hypothetical protein